MTDTGASEMYWQCKGCGELFEKESNQEKMEHAEVVHGSIDAVTFTAVMSWEVDKQDTGTEPGGGGSS